MEIDHSIHYDASEVYRGQAKNGGRDRTISPRHLCACLDVELPRAKRQALEQRLETNATLQSRVAALAQVRDRLRLAYETILTD